MVNENDSSVTLLEVASGRIVKTIAVGTEPETAVASPDGKWIVVSNETSNDVHVIDTATQAVVKKIAVPKNPRGMRFSADSRRLFVASEQAHVVSVIDVATLTVEKSVPTGGSRPVGRVRRLDGQHRSMRIRPAAQRLQPTRPLLRPVPVPHVDVQSQRRHEHLGCVGSVEHRRQDAGAWPGASVVMCLAAGCWSYLQRAAPGRR